MITVESLNMDLHMHSCYSSDGEYTPSELMQMCYDANMQVVAIADHNSLAGIQEGKLVANKLGMEFITGIELDCIGEGINFHVLGYGIDEGDPALNELSHQVRKMEQKNSQKLLSRVKELGIYVDEEDAYDLAKDYVVTGEIIAEVALKDSRNHEFLKEYLRGGKRDDNPLVNFYWDFCAQGKPAHVSPSYISMGEAVKMIHNAGGIAILAHPGNNTRDDADLLEVLFFAYDLDGLEAYSSYHIQDQISFYTRWATLRNLLITAGSDFHGKTKPIIHIGDTRCDQTMKLYFDLKKELTEKYSSK